MFKTTVGTIATITITKPSLHILFPSATSIVHTTARSTAAATYITTQIQTAVITQIQTAVITQIQTAVITTKQILFLPPASTWSAEQERWSARLSRYRAVSSFTWCFKACSHVSFWLSIWTHTISPSVQIYMDSDFKRRTDSSSEKLSIQGKCIPFQEQEGL